MAVIPTRPKVVMRAEHVEDHAGLPGLVEAQPGARQQVEEVLDPQPPQAGVVEVVGGHEVALLPPGVTNRAPWRVVASVGEELQGQERVGRAALAQVDLDGVGLPLLAAPHGHEVDGEAAQHALRREQLPDPLGVLVIRAAYPGSAGNRQPR